MLNEGIYTNLDLTDDQYHADRESISRSTIMEFKRSPYHYYAKYIENTAPEKEVSDALVLGSAFHKMILEPKRFEKEYAVAPVKVLLKDVGAKLYQEYKTKLEKIEASDLTKLTANAYAQLLAMKNRLTNHEEARALIEGGKNEHSLVWREPHSGLMCKARPDVWHEDIIVDLKTCEDANPRKMAYEMRDRGYHIQAAMIRDGIQQLTGKTINNFVLLCVEKKYPYAIAIYFISRDAIERGKQEYVENLLQIKSANEYNIFRSYETLELNLP